MAFSLNMLRDTVCVMNMFGLKRLVEAIETGQKCGNLECIWEKRKRERKKRGESQWVCIHCTRASKYILKRTQKRNFHCNTQTSSLYIFIRFIEEHTSAKPATASSLCPRMFCRIWFFFSPDFETNDRIQFSLQWFFSFKHLNLSQRILFPHV